MSRDGTIYWIGRLNILIGRPDMARTRIIYPTLALSLLLAGLLTYLAARPAELRALSTEADTSRSGAAISFVDGTVEVRLGSGQWRPARRGQVLHAGDAVRTGKSGRAELAFDDRPGRLRLDSRTRILFKGDRSITGGHVGSGSVWAEVSPWREQTPTFRLGTAAVGARAFDATYRVHVVSPDSVRTAVYRGRATVAPATRATGRTPSQAGQEVAEGFAVTAIRGGRLVLEAIRHDEDWKDGWLHRDDAGAHPNTGASAPRTSSVRSLRHELTDISPDVYLSVQLELRGTHNSTSGFRAREVQIRRISIRSRRWDGMDPERKVTLLNETFSLLKDRYPNIRHSVVLQFDDGRPDLELKYGGSATG